MKKTLEAISAFIQKQPNELLPAFIQANKLQSCDAGEQYWGQPYDKRYLVLTFPGFDFKLTDLLWLSRSPTFAQDDDKDVIDSIEARQLRDATWLTTCDLSALQEDIYLHFTFIGSDAEIAHTSHKISLQELSVRPPADMLDGVVLRPHPRVAPTAIPFATATPMAGKHLAPAASVGAAALPYTKIFLSFDGWTFPQINCYGVDGQAEKWDYLAISDHDPSSPTDHYTNGYCYVSNLTDSVYYNFMTWALTWGGDGWRHQKWHNANFWTLDLDAAAKMRMWYVRWQNNQWVRIGEVVGFQSDFPNWMRDLQAKIGNKKLHQIAIPGTHDSGCFDLYAKFATETFSQAQNLDFSGQLQYGVRYFDLRLYIADDGNYYFNHADTRTYTTVNNFVSALENFLGQPNNKEIVIADFSRFGQKIGANFAPSDYQKILELFTNSTVLKPLLANGAHTTDTIGQLMSNNKRLILLCDKAQDSWFTTITAALNISVSPSINIDSEWANTSQMSTLKSWLQDQVSNHASASGLWSLQAQLTPIPLFQTMQEVATTCDAVAAKWVNDLWPNSVNVVFCDFITGGGLVDVLIKCNENRP